MKDQKFVELNSQKVAFNNAKEIWESSRSEDYNLYREEWHDRPRRLEHGRVPLHLDIEATSNCNLKCIMCPRTELINNGTFWKIEDFPFEMYKTIIRNNTPKGLKSIKYQYLGEPTLAKNLPEMIRFAKSEGIEDTLINTNGTTLTPSLSRSLIESGLDKLSFSFDSPYREEYNKIRVNSDYDKVLNRISKFKKLRDELKSNTPFITIQIVVYPDTSSETISDFYNLFADFVDEVRTCAYLPHTNIESSKSKKENDANEFTWVCPQLFQRMFIHSDGVVTPCCNDSARILNMGNINESSVEEIWNGKAYNALRSAHTKGLGMSISPCNQCGLAKLSYDMQHEQ